MAQPPAVPPAGLQPPAQVVVEPVDQDGVKSDKSQPGLPAAAVPKQVRNGKAGI